MATRVDTLYKQAVTLHQTGQLLEARKLYEQVLQALPQQVYVLNLLGMTDIQIGEPQRSLRFFELATELKPDFEEAYNNWGVALKELKHYEAAIACCEKALSIKPSYAEAHFNLGVVLNALRRPEDAILSYRQAIAFQPDYIEAHNNLGIALNDLDRTEEAASHYQQALSINPDFPFAHCNMGGIHLLREDNTAALASFKRALALHPVYAEAQLGLAKTYLALERTPLAKQAALQALELEPGNAKIHAMLGSLHTELEEPRLAKAHFQQALGLDGSCHEAMLGLGHLCMENGDMEKAKALFRQAIELRPNNLQAHFQLTQLKKVTPSDTHFLTLQDLEQKISGLADDNSIALHFALGKCYDDIGDSVRAFPHFLTGCQLKRAKLSYEPERVSQQFADLMKIFDQDTIERLHGAGNPSPVPIFVLGMPRSGTTLTEQIIASHPDVHGAGELGELFRVTRRSFANNSKPLGFPNHFRSINQEMLTAWGTDYVAAIQRRAPEARHITDKMPSNFLVIGLIHLMLPNAKIIHVKRNPVDTCLSCFTHLFRRKLQEHTYDLAELGRYYADYERLMNHWRGVLPAGSFMEVQYEEIVTDQASQARRLIDYCGLAWSDSCLHFHKTQRTVRTSSLTQVRQPIYTSSVERWRPYQQFLQPLLEALGDLVPNKQFDT